MKNSKKSMLKISHTIKPESEGGNFNEWMAFIAAQRERENGKFIKRDGSNEKEND